MFFLLQKIARSVGLSRLDKPSINSSEYRKFILVKQLEIDCIVEIASEGECFGQSMRKKGYEGKLVSIVTNPLPFNQLKHAAKNDLNWAVVPIEIENPQQTPNLDGIDILENIALDQSYHQHFLDVNKILPIWRKEVLFTNRIMLKLNSGYSALPILEELATSLLSVNLIAMDLSLEPLHSSHSLLTDILPWLQSKGYYVSLLKNKIEDTQCLSLLEVEVWFVRA